MNWITCLLLVSLTFLALPTESHAQRYNAQIEPLPQLGCGRPRNQRMPVDEMHTIPPGAVVRMRANRPLIISGSIIFAASYVPTMLVGVLGAGLESAYDSTKPIFGRLAVPLIGGFLFAAADEGASGLAIGSSVLQLAGLGFWIAGIIHSRSHATWVGCPEDAFAKPAPDWQFTGDGFRLRF